jgi:hypothetical protein
MKLYATVTSERATKGQGGRTLDIKIQGENKEYLARILIGENQDGNIELSLYRNGAIPTDTDIFPLYPNTKGKSQKGEILGVEYGLKRGYSEEDYKRIT